MLLKSKNLALPFLGEKQASPKPDLNYSKWETEHVSHLAAVARTDLAHCREGITSV